MKRLFQVNNPNGKVYTVEAGGFSAPMYVENKSKAKEVRDALNKENGGGFTVTVGPDHFRFNNKA